MTIQMAMQSYFERLNECYHDVLGTAPTISWAPELDDTLFCSAPDEDDEVEWQPMPGEPFDPKQAPTLCVALQEFYSAFYHWQLSGVCAGIFFSFAAVPNASAMYAAAQTALSDGQYYFPNEDIACVATCATQDDDALLLCYQQDTNRLFLYQQDTARRLSFAHSLTALICALKAVV